MFWRWLGKGGGGRGDLQLTQHIHTYTHTHTHTHSTTRYKLTLIEGLGGLGKKVKNVSPSLHNAMSATEGLVRTLGDRAKAFKAFSVVVLVMKGTVVM